MRRRRAEAGLPDIPLRVVVSDQSHSSITNTLNITMMSALVVDTPDGVLTRQALRSALDGRTDLDDVCAIVATAGTTNAGIIDDIAGAAELAGEHGWWLHVDGAYGGAGMLAPELRHRYAGVEHADSLVMDPHKWWFAPFDSAALLYREPRLAKAVHTQDASYLDVIHEHESDINPSDLAYHLTRRARGLPLWFSMAVNGIAAYREAVQHSLEMARYAAARLAAHPECELIREPDLSVVLFRRRGWGHAEYEAWSRTPPRGAAGVRDVQRMARRDRRPAGLPAPGHDDGDGRRGHRRPRLGRDLPTSESPGSGEPGDPRCGAIRRSGRPCAGPSR